MPNHVAKVIEVVGTSDNGLEDAITGAVERTAEMVQHMRWFEVTEIRGHLKGGKVDRYQVMLKIGFALSEDE